MPFSDEYQIASELPIPDLEVGGHPINLIVAVRDHAPGRIDAIQKEMSELERRMHELHVEEQTLTKLLAVVS